MPSETANSEFVPVTAALTSGSATSGWTHSGKGKLSVVISGTFTGTVNIEASRDGGVTAVPVLMPDLATPVGVTRTGAFNMESAENLQYRFNSTIATGTANVYMRQQRHSA